MKLLSRRDVAWCVVVVLLVLLGYAGDSGGGQQSPARDSRFCADANGDGVLDVSDPITILQHIFLGSATPYCVAEDTSLDDLATKGELAALAARVEALADLSTRLDALEARTSPPFEVKTYVWRPGNPAIRMIHESEGICYLSGVGGNFKGGGEQGVVEMRDDGYWYLVGQSAQPSLWLHATSIKLWE